MKKRTFDWIRYDGVFIKVRKHPGGNYTALVTEVMPDFPVREMLVAATFEGTFVERAPIAIEVKEEEGIMPRPTAKELKKIRRQKRYAQYSWPVRIVLGLIEFTLYIVLGTGIIAIASLPIIGIAWLIGRMGGAW